MSDDFDERMESLRRATDGIRASGGLVERVAAAVAARPSGWTAALALIERRGWLMTAAAALACVALLSVNLHGVGALDELIMRVLVEAAP